MSAAYTEGLLAVSEQYAHILKRVDELGPTTELIGSTMGENANANARRLAACWNALDSVPTEEIERFSDDDPIMRVFKALGRAKVASDYLNIANTLLSDALEVFDADLSKDHEVADRIRTFLKGQP